MCTSRSLSPTAAMRSATQIRKSFAGLPSRTSSAGSREHFARAMKSAQRAQSGSSAGMDREGLQRKCLTMIANKVEKISGAKSPASRKNLAELMLPRRGAEGRHFNFCINQKRLSFRPRIFADFGKIGNFLPCGSKVTNCSPLQILSWIRSMWNSALATASPQGRTASWSRPSSATHSRFQARVTTPLGVGGRYQINSRNTRLMGLRPGDAPFRTSAAARALACGIALRRAQKGSSRAPPIRRHDAAPPPQGIHEGRMRGIGESLGDIADLQTRDGEQFPRHGETHLIQKFLEARAFRRDWVLTFIFR